jgi:hypothetical protein
VEAASACLKDDKQLRHSTCTNEFEIFPKALRKALTVSQKELQKPISSMSAYATAYPDAAIGELVLDMSANSHHFGN